MSNLPVIIATTSQYGADFSGLARYCGQQAEVIDAFFDPYHQRPNTDNITVSVRFSDGRNLCVCPGFYTMVSGNLTRFALERARDRLIRVGGASKAQDIRIRRADRTNARNAWRDGKPMF